MDVRRRIFRAARRKRRHKLPRYLALRDGVTALKSCVGYYINPGNYGVRPFCCLKRTETVMWCVYGPDLDLQLRRRGIATIVIVGIATIWT
ncbi:hypothetical protein [Gluconobacter wancherniae]